MIKESVKEGVIHLDQVGADLAIQVSGGGLQIKYQAKSSIIINPPPRIDIKDYKVYISTTSNRRLLVIKDTSKISSPFDLPLSRTLSCARLASPVEVRQLITFGSRVSPFCLSRCDIVRGLNRHLLRNLKLYSTRTS